MPNSDESWNDLLYYAVWQAVNLALVFGSTCSSFRWWIERSRDDGQWFRLRVEYNNDHCLVRPAWSRTVEFTIGNLCQPKFFYRAFLAGIRDSGKDDGPKWERVVPSSRVRYCLLGVRDEACEA